MDQVATTTTSGQDEQPLQTAIVLPESTNGKPELLKTKVVSIGELLQYRDLTIPIYQRPYKWQSKHVLQLIKDIHTFRDKSAYRLGTLVIHDDKGVLNIVDGQQRVITLLLIVQAILVYHLPKIEKPGLKDQLQKLKENLFNPAFENEITIKNIRANYATIEREVISFDEDLILFLLNKCEMIQFVLTDISEAFQFFDAQNARGKDLEPHDLLKAYHLREFPAGEEDLMTRAVDEWEDMDTPVLSALFSDFLFRVKSWSKLHSARYFSKNEIDLFKGVNLHKTDSFPFAVPLQITHYVTDNYSQHFDRNVDRKFMRFPFQLDQVIVNGRRFFEMVAHYKKMYDDYKKNITCYTTRGHISERIIETLDSYEGRSRTGDAYVRMLFDCTLLFYIDKFGHAYIDKAIEKIFIWAYKLRLKYRNVQLASVDNYVLQEVNVFRIIKDAYTPDDLFSMSIGSIDASKSTKTESIENLFKELKYHG